MNDSNDGCGCFVVVAVIIGICIMISGIKGCFSSSGKTTPETTIVTEDDAFRPLPPPTPQGSLNLKMKIPNPIESNVQSVPSSGGLTPDDAYDEGYDEGYEQGRYDAANGLSHGSGYDDSSSFYGYYETKYQEGYQEGYEEGYDEGFNDGQYEYEEEQDEYYDDNW